MINPETKMVIELSRIEKLSIEYAHELKYLSRRIRYDMWIVEKNSKVLAAFLSGITDKYELTNNSSEMDTSFNLNSVIEYVEELAKYSAFYNPLLDNAYFKKLEDDIQLESATYSIEPQLEDIYKAKDGYKSFLELFDDIFTNHMNLYKDKFFHKLDEDDILCRAVDVVTHDTDRFIPWPSVTNNRWNPPGRQFLYLSYSEREKKYSSELSLNEYICLKEIRAKTGEKYTFCNFKHIAPGNILDLSYNDVSLAKIQRDMNENIENSARNIQEKVLRNPHLNEICLNKRKLKRVINASSRKSSVQGIVSEGTAKQYLKMICSCIYKKVDETDEDKKAKAYKSFHILSKYLESKGVTGIIYPCTRTDKVIGKNLVLFNVNDAVPIESTIREYYYK